MLLKCKAWNIKPLFYRAGLPKIAVEAGVTLGWSRYTGSEDNVLGIDRFGASAPGDVMMEKYGFTVENLVAKVKSVL